MCFFSFMTDRLREWTRQQRLPARLHNAIVTVSKNGIKAVVMSNGKVPAQFPATRGEFEHLTSKIFSSLFFSDDKS